MGPGDSVECSPRKRKRKWEGKTFFDFPVFPLPPLSPDRRNPRGRPFSIPSGSAIAGRKIYCSLFLKRAFSALLPLFPADPWDKTVEVDYASGEEEETLVGRRKIGILPQCTKGRGKRQGRGVSLTGNKERKWLEGSPLPPN